MIRQEKSHAGMHHGPGFPSPAKTPTQANTSSSRSGEVPLLAANAGDFAAVLARGFETSPVSSGTTPQTQSQHNQPPPPPPSGGDRRSVYMRADPTNGGMHMKADNNSGMRMSADKNNNQNKNKSNNKSNNNNNNHNNSSVATTDANKHGADGACVDNKGNHSTRQQRNRGQDAAAAAAVASGGKRSTRAQKKTAKKWLSKRQGRMPDGGPTTSGEALS